MKQPKIETLGPLKRYEIAKIALVVKPGDIVEFSDIGDRGIIKRGKVTEVTDFNSNEIAVKVKVTHTWSIDQWVKSMTSEERWIDWWHVCRVNNTVVNQQADYSVSNLMGVGDYVEFMYRFTLEVENKSEPENKVKINIKKLCSGIVKSKSFDGDIEVSSVSVIGNKDIGISIMGNEGVSIPGLSLSIIGIIIPDVSIVAENYTVLQVNSKSISYINNGTEKIDILSGNFVLYELLRNKLKGSY